MFSRLILLSLPFFRDLRNDTRAIGCVSMNSWATTAASAESPLASLPPCSRDSTTSGPITVVLRQGASPMPKQPNCSSTAVSKPSQPATSSAARVFRFAISSLSRNFVAAAAVLFDAVSSAAAGSEIPTNTKTGAVPSASTHRHATSSAISVTRRMSFPRLVFPLHTRLFTRASSTPAVPVTTRYTPRSTGVVTRPEIRLP